MSKSCHHNEKPSATGLFTKGQNLVAAGQTSKMPSTTSGGVCLLVEGRGSRVTSRGSRVNGRGSRVKGRGSRVNGRGSRVNSRG